MEEPHEYKHDCGGEPKMQSIKGAISGSRMRAHVYEGMTIVK